MKRLSVQEEVFLSEFQWLKRPYLQIDPKGHVSSGTSQIYFKTAMRSRKLITHALR